MRRLLIILLIVVLYSCTSDENAKATQAVQSKSIDTAMVNIKSTRLNIDPVKVSPNKFKILLENEHVRVVKYSLNPGEKDEWHTHPAKSSYVVSGGQLKVFLENGEIIIADEKTGTASWMDYVGKHYVENIGNTKVTIILTELKSLE